MAALFQKGNMAQSAKIRPEQSSRARKLLQDLPRKLLEKDFRKAMQKGYSAKEISAILKNEDIIMVTGNQVKSREGINF